MFHISFVEFISIDGPMLSLSRWTQFDSYLYYVYFEDSSWWIFAENILMNSAWWSSSCLFFDEFLVTDESMSNCSDEFISMNLSCTCLMNSLLIAISDSVVCLILMDSSWGVYVKPGCIHLRNLFYISFYGFFRPLRIFNPYLFYQIHGVLMNLSHSHFYIFVEFVNPFHSIYNFACF